MNIGLIIYGSLDTLSGGYLYDRKLVEYLRARGDTVEIISLPWRNYAVHLTDSLWFRLWSPGARSWRNRQRSAGLDRFDVIVEDELNHPSLIIANRGKHRCPIVSLVHHLRSSELRPEWQNAFYRFIEKTYLRSVDGFIFNSWTTKKVVQGLINRNMPSVVAYPPTDRFGSPISENAIRERATADEFRILFLGNVIYRKGLHTLLEAVNGLKQRPEPFEGSKVHVDVIGSLTSEPAYVKLIQEIIEKNDLSSCISLYGPLDRELLGDKLRQAHVLVVPSSYEGFGIVYLEGMCFGLPTIGTTAGAAGEVIEHGRTGYLIAPDDAASLAKHLQSLAENRALLARLSLHARERYLRQPSWNESAKNIRDFLYSLT